MISKYRVTILVKASPQPSKSHSETVCCAGIDETGMWRRLYPIRFRHLSDEKMFSRWNVVSFQSSTPRNDKRWESCRVHEETIEIVETVKRESVKANLVAKGMFASEAEACSKGNSLALIRPEDVRLTWKRRSDEELHLAKNSYERQMRQMSMLDKEVEAYSPCPYEFKMHYRDQDGPHVKTCGDWETAAAFFNLSKKYGEQEALQIIHKKYCEEYPRKGLVFALGNMAKRPQTWQLLGIFPCPKTEQFSLL